MAKESLSRRVALKRLAAAASGALLWPQIIRGQSNDIAVAGKPVEIAIWSLSPTTVRISVRPIQDNRPVEIANTGALVQPQLGEQRTRQRSASALSRIRAGDLTVRFTAEPPTLHVENRNGEVVQKLTLDAAQPGMSFLLPRGPLLGLGEGGPQFDRKGARDEMRNGQGGYRLATHGTRAPVQWLVGTDGWAMFVHQPYGPFDFTGSEGKFQPTAENALPLDVFIVSSKDPRVIMREYARISGFPEMPARWTFGYMQSHRTLGGPEEIMGVARTMREKKLPCDALIYLGTEFAPSGWNTRNGEFTWHTGNFPDPKAMLDALHALHYRVIVHVVIEGRRLLGSVTDPCTAAPLPSGRTSDDRWPPERQVSCYWPVHKQVMDVGVDGWWPDQGDGLDGPSRLNRHRMYWEGTQLYRPNERPFALHRNASPGIQRFGGFIWSGDVESRWETLKTHVAVGINTALSGLPYWGTDIGGFRPGTNNTEYTGELHVRWFQFGAFCASFRAHGRNWHLRLPWGWNGGDGGPFEAGAWRADPAELQNPNVEPICRKYMELRSRLMPYLYTAVRECHDTGMPIMRALWLHHPDDAIAAARGDEYFWGPDLLVAPVVEKGATTRRVYLPRGTWYDFWTNERVEGGREIERPVDLATTPLYVRAGAVLPLGPVKQYTDEPSDEPLVLQVYPGVSSASTLYEDDGLTFDYRRGESMRIAMQWRDDTRRLSLRLAPGSRMLPPTERRIGVVFIGTDVSKTVVFNGRPLEVQL
jgi:alpha-glucosidase (family GH31 glycosyl hydrolase)